MTGRTGRAGQVVVVVDMAIEADARRIGVCIGERETHGGVVKGCRLPRDRAVALLTVLREPPSNVTWIRGALEILQMA